MFPVKLSSFSVHGRHQRGFSMIEVLVTLLIISLALLGTAGLQAYAMRQNQNGQFRTQAVFLASDLAERMEANKAGALQGRYEVERTQNPRQTALSCSATPCSVTDLATFDLANWEAEVSGTLPQSSWTVTARQPLTNPVVYTITIEWVDRRAAGNNEDIGSGGTHAYVATRTVYQ